MSEPTVSLHQLWRRFRYRILLTWALVVGEAILFLFFPLLMGIAIDDFVAGVYRGLALLGLVGLLSLIVGAARRFYDTRVYAGIYATISPELVDREKQRDASVSSISARANMLTEFVEFLENSFPEIINCVISLIGTLAILLFLNLPVFVACAVGTALIGLVYGLTSGFTYRLNRGYNDQLEQQVNVLSGSDQAAIKSHFRSVARWNIRLSDLETINFSLSWVFLFAILLFTIVASVQGGATTQGRVLAILMYVFDYIESIITIPLFYQQHVRLKEITHRLES